jgi:hypothetical protein
VPRRVHNPLSSRWARIAFPIAISTRVYRWKFRFAVCPRLITQIGITERAWVNKKPPRTRETHPSGNGANSWKWDWTRNSRRGGIQSQRIDVTDWVRPNIRVCVDSAFQPDRIALYIPSRRRIIISEVVVDRSARRDSSYTTTISPVPSSA